MTPYQQLESEAWSFISDFCEIHKLPKTAEEDLRERSERW